MLNWSKVDAGNTLFKLDRTKVDGESLRVLEKVGAYYKIQLADGKIAPERIDSPDSVRITIEKAKKIGPFLKADQPWEVQGINLGSLLFHEGKYRLWYSCSYQRGKVIQVAEDRYKLEYGVATCYAESEDGIAWRKPDLDLVEFNGSRKNNILSKDARLNGLVFVDPAAPPVERYKMLASVSTKAFDPKIVKNVGALAGATSADGIHWAIVPKPLWTGHISDTWTGAFRDPDSGKYIGFFRTSHHRRRSIGRSETADFGTWPIPATVLAPGPEEEPWDDYYTNGYARYPGVADAHLVLCAVYHRNTGFTDVRLATSTDSQVWNWVSREPVVERGDEGAWDGGQIYTGSEMVRLPDGRVGVPLLGHSASHNEFWRTYYERDYPNALGLGWAVWEDGRLAGIEARQHGQFTTLPLVMSGTPVLLNSRTSASGSLRVELIDSAGKRTIRSREMAGDKRWAPIEWEDRVDLRALAGKSVRMRFLLYDSKVFGIRM